jgi:formylglycine-generating enzyme required for sulfatase activity
MNRPHRSIEIFTMSALDLFVTAMGSFAILMMILFPYFKGDRKKQAEERQGHILICAWPTRVKDYAQFKKETELPGRKEIKREEREMVADEDSWKEPGYEQGPDFPVVSVSWAEAQAFCQWLTKKERAARLIGPEDEYRLPTLAEWTAAVGPDKYPWGNQWPPPPKTGNFGGEEYAKGLGYSGAGADMRGYTDEHELAAPVASYKPNRDGLYDVAGNVSIWLDEWYRKEIEPKHALQDDGNGKKYRVYVGSTWDSDAEWQFESNHPLPAMPEARWQTNGFRCVLVIKSPPKS